MLTQSQINHALVEVEKSLNHVVQKKSKINKQGTTYERKDSE